MKSSSIICKALLHVHDTMHMSRYNVILGYMRVHVMCSFLEMNVSVCVCVCVCVCESVSVCVCV